MNNMRLVKCWCGLVADESCGVPAVVIDLISDLTQRWNDLIKRFGDDDLMRICEIEPVVFVFEENFVELWFNRVHV